MKAFKLYGIIFSSLTFAATAAYLYSGKVESADFSSKSKTVKNNKRPLELHEASAKSSKTSKESAVVMNDPAISQAWGIKKSDAERAWEVSQGSKKIIVAVIDTGIDVKHEDIKGNLWVNKGEIPGNGIDDDGNGLIDDVYGWNFVSGNGDLTDNHGHGTHIAGIIGAEAGNGKGIAGIAPQVSMMILKYYDPKVPNTDNLKNTVNSIRYAIKMGAHIINYSGGGTEFSQDEKDAIEEARQKGILFVAAAGNERSNSDKHKYYPADYGLSNIISVTAIDPSTEVLASSNYGVETVDIAAPGQNILSTLPNNTYGYMTGTSQATAFVTGAAVLVMAHKENFVPEDVKKHITSTGDSEKSLLAKCRTSKQLNLFKALAILDSGTGLNGVVAANGVNMTRFTVEASKDPNLAKSDDNARDVANFGKSMIQALEASAVPKKN